MPGFVDVTGWSREDIRRLGHADEDDEVVIYKRTPTKKIVKKPTFSYDADTVWGAAVIAFYANNGYVKALAPGVPAHKTNRQIVDHLLMTNEEIGEEFMEEGRKIRQYFKGLTFKKLEGKALSPFLTSAMETASKDNITDNLGIGIITSLPASYEKMNKRDSVDNRIKWARGGFIGEVGDNVTENIEIVKKLWSGNYNTWYLTGINDKDQVLFFPHKHDMEIGTCVTITGKVKSHRENSTQLSHVKVI